MLKNLSSLQHVIGDKVYHFMCDSSSPLNEVEDALVKFLQYVGSIKQQVQAQQAAQQPPVEEPVSDVAAEPVAEEPKPE